MATHARILASIIPWAEEPGGLQSMGLQSVGCGSEAEYMRAHMQTLSCAYGIPVPGPGMESKPPALGAHSLSH